jgi:hypothetical protein
VGIFKLALMSTILNIDVVKQHYMRFPMEDGGKLVIIHIASSWLKERAARDRQRTDNLALLCNFYRDEIEAAASANTIETTAMAPMSWWSHTI